VTSLGSTFEAYRSACFESSGVVQMKGPGNFVTEVVAHYDCAPIKKTIMESLKKAKFEPIEDAPQNLKDVSQGYKCQDCLEGSLPALALFLERDPFTFTSMSLESNHRTVNPKSFLHAKEDKPPIVDAIKIAGNKSFQTSEVVIGFYVLAKRKDNSEPCLRSIGSFDFESTSAGKLPCRSLPFVTSQTFRSLTNSF
jgi:hypothetical protein